MANIINVRFIKDYTEKRCGDTKEHFVGEQQSFIINESMNRVR